MKKNIYEAPTTEMFDVNICLPIASSIAGVSMGKGFTKGVDMGGTMGESDVADSRHGRSFWDDEE